MPSQSTLTVEERVKVKTALSESTFKIRYAAVTRIYYAHPDAKEWSDPGLQGGIVLCLELKTKKFCFKLVDLEGTRGIIWAHEIQEGFQLNMDGALHLSFRGDRFVIALAFTSESECKTFYKKVKTSDINKIDKSKISAPKPDSFIHVSHIGYDVDLGFTSKGVDPSWTKLIENLENVVGKDVVAREMAFIKNFIKKFPEQQAKSHEKPKPPPSPSRKSVVNRNLSPSSTVPPLGSSLPRPRGPPHSPRLLMHPQPPSVFSQVQQPKAPITYVVLPDHPLGLNSPLVKSQNITPNCRAGGKMDLATFCHVYALPNPIKQLLEANKITGTNAFEYITSQDLKDMGLKLGEIIDLKEAIKVWAQEQCT